MTTKMEKFRYDQIKMWVSNCKHEIDMNPGIAREVLNKYFKRLNNDEERTFFYLSWKISDEEFMEIASTLKTQDKIAEYLHWDKSLVAAKIFAINKYAEYEDKEEVVEKFK